MAARLATKDVVGRRFGRLLTEGIVRKGGRLFAACICDCGNRCVPSFSHLKTGYTNSCGCLRGEAHGMSRTRLHSIWLDIKKRCFNPRGKYWRRYGGRGITLAPEWHYFSQFAADMGEPPSLEHSIDRIDNDGPYSKANCRWATATVQSRNRSNALPLVRHGGRTLHLKDWAKETGISYSTMRYRQIHGLPIVG